MNTDQSLPPQLTPEQAHELNEAGLAVTNHMHMVSLLKKPGEAILDTLTPEKCDLWHMATGIVGEAGELTDAIKKAVAYNKELDRENVIEELGDLEFYLEGLRQILGISRTLTLQHNLNKLLTGKNARYASAVYSDQQAQDRADKQEPATTEPQPPEPYRPKVLILGHGRHGKDTVAELLNQLTGLTYISSSWFANEKAVYHVLKDLYVDANACFADRSNQRALWHSLIKNYNAEDPTKLATELLEEADIYVGMRAQREYQACRQKGLFDLVLWVDASHRSALESVTSFNISYDPKVMVLIDNNGNEAMLVHELRHKLGKLLNFYVGT